MSPHLSLPEGRLMNSQSESSNLDALRSLAVLSVCTGHLLWTLGIARGSVRWLGELGVLAFLVHTSLVLMLSLERSPQSGVGRMTAAFYLRRAFRIYPLAMTCVVMTAALRIPAAPWVEWQSPGVGEVASNLLLIQNLSGHSSIIGPLWSLPYEVQMYLALPFLYAWLCFRSPFRAVACWAASCLLYMIVRIGWPQSPVLGLIQYVPCFAAGLIAWKLLRRPVRQSLPGWLWIPAMLGAGAAFLPALAWQGQGKIIPRWCFCLLLGLLIPRFREMRMKLFTRVPHVIAKYSFGVYLTHMAALYLSMRWLRAGDWQRFAVLTFLVVALPVAAYHLVEAPSIRFGRRIAAAVTLRAAAWMPPQSSLPAPDRSTPVGTVSDRRNTTPSSGLIQFE
jgi:peptidoglycan/LPS O-acetylase OafA/YrhL